MNLTQIFVLAATMLMTAAACGDDAATSTEAAGAGGTGAGGSGAGGGGAVGGGDAGMGGATSSGGAGGGSASGGAGGTGGSPSCPTVSDELDDAATLGCWSVLEPSLHEVLELDTLVADHLVVEPYASGWYADDRGPYLFKEVSGSFVVEVHAAAVDEDDAQIAPTGAYHSAGVLARDPASVTGDESWLVYNVGYQGDQGATTGTEGKTTVDSTSVLTIYQGAHSGLLRMCRIGSDFYFFKWLDDESEWTQEHHYTRADLPDTVQLGMMVNAWPPGATTDPRNIQARFGHFHYAPANELADCTAVITPE